MSDSLNLERLRKEAKTLLAQCRAGDGTAIARMRARLPRLAALDNQQIAAQIKLADIHHALAREQEHRSWADLKRHDDPVTPPSRAVPWSPSSSQRTERRNYTPSIGNGQR